LRYFLNICIERLRETREHLRIASVWVGIEPGTSWCNAGEVLFME
jgi:hypothetical protein